MHHKNIKLLVRKQLKKQYPNWNRLNRKIKKNITLKVLEEVTSEYDFKQTVTASREELLGIEQQIPTKGIIKLDAMARFIDMVKGNRIIKFFDYHQSSAYLYVIPAKAGIQG